jgi:membrane protease YdiL (CAAX protease family)
LRVLTGFIALYAATYIVRLFMGVVPNLLMRHYGASPDFRAFVGATLNYGVGIVASIVFPAIALRVALRRHPWAQLFPFQSGWWKQVLIGFLIVVSVLLVLFWAEQRAGWLEVQGWNWNSLSAIPWVRVAWVGLLVNFGVAVGEETIFRGYLLSGLQTAWGKWPGLVVMTGVFGLFHVPAYMSDRMPPAALTLALLLASAFGLLFGLIYLQTGTLWLPTALHFPWNYVENDVLNLTAESSNPNLVGAVTAANVGLAYIVLLEALAFAVIAVAVGLWLWTAARARDARRPA